MTVMAPLPSLVFYLAPTAVLLLALAILAESARRLRLPVVATTVIVGTAVLAVWHGQWSAGGNDAAYFSDLVPADLGDRIAAARQDAFDPNWNQVQPGEEWVDPRPWPLRPPQVGTLVTVIFWGALSALIATLVRIRRPRPSRTRFA